MKYLIFDTSSNVMIVIISDNTKILAQTQRVGKKDHGAFLVNQIDQTLKAAGLSLSQIDVVITGIGPGSYTGLRVAVMSAKMLGLFTKIEVQAISSLLLLTSGYTQAFAYNEAKSDAGFAGFYQRGVLIGSEGLIKRTELSKTQAKHLVVLDEHTIKLDLKVIIQKAKKVDDINALVPNYSRLTEAESKLR